MKFQLAAVAAVLLFSTSDALRPRPAALDSSHVSAFTTKAPPRPISLPTRVAFTDIVKPLIAKSSQDEMSKFLVRLTQFPERDYKSLNGVAASAWIAQQARALKLVPGTKLTISNFTHSRWIVPSVIITYESTSPTSLQGSVITGSHIDTTAQGAPKPQPYPNPAADDCASGSAVVWEALRTLVTSGFVPGRPIEFHWYTAEEEGLYGSNEVSEAYAKAGKQVVSYLNLDQSGYVRKGTLPIMGLTTDYTSKDSTNFLKSVITSYTDLSWKATACGYQCTDNSPWYNHGYEAAMAFESLMEDASPYNDRVNRDGSPLDTLDTIQMGHVYEFVKSTLGYIVELSLAGSRPSF